jgi:hypothetical protein
VSSRADWSPAAIAHWDGVDSGDPSQILAKLEAEGIIERFEGRYRLK